MNNSTLQIKQALRQSYRQSRKNLTFGTRQKKAKELAALFITHKEFLSSEKIAIYLPRDGEISPVPLLKQALSLGKQCYLPLLDPTKPQLWFMKYQLGDALIKNRFGIKEPVLDPKKIIPAQDLDLVLTPLVAFDSEGHRLGMGKGYYDHTFSFLRETNKADKPKLIGLGYEIQAAEIIPNNNWDISLFGVVTEKRFLVFKEQKNHSAF